MHCKWRWHHKAGEQTCRADLSMTRCMGLGLFSFPLLFCPFLPSLHLRTHFNIFLLSFLLWKTLRVWWILEHQIRANKILIVLWHYDVGQNKTQKVMKSIQEWNRERREKCITVRWGAAGNTLRADDGHPSIHKYQGELSQLCKEHNRQAGLSKQEEISIKC